MYLIAAVIIMSTSQPYSSLPWQTSSHGISTDYCVFDYDNDGDIDVAFCDYEYPDGGTVKLYMNVEGKLIGPVWESEYTGGCSCLTAR